MTKLGAGVHGLNPAFFWNGASAHDANDYIVYSRATGYLSYDSNGNGVGGMTLLAILSNKPALQVNDFTVI
jgi:serralysin